MGGAWDLPSGIGMRGTFGTLSTGGGAQGMGRQRGVPSVPPITKNHQCGIGMRGARGMLDAGDGVQGMERQRGHHAYPAYHPIPKPPMWYWYAWYAWYAGYAWRSVQGSLSCGIGMRGTRGMPGAGRDGIGMRGMRGTLGTRGAPCRGVCHVDKPPIWYWYAWYAWYVWYR